MSGGYVHITLVQEAIEEARYRRPGLLHEDALQALGYWKKFSIVGAISPDYPYLDITDGQSADWADRMHKHHSVSILRGGVERIRNMDDADVRQKCLAWLLGFASHMATDGTIHPVVNLKVGEPYEDHKTAHRRCEMSQDVFIHSRLNLGAIEFNRQISTNVNDSSDMGDEDRLDPDIARLWESLLIDVYPGFSPPKLHDWHRAMRRMVKLAESGNRLIPFMRHVAANQGLVYPSAPEETYISKLRVPGDHVMDFEEIYQKALHNVLELWGAISLTLQNKPSDFDEMVSWSLDSGIDENNIMKFWS